MVFLGGGVAAFTMLNIEAYPQPAPVIIEITAQQGGLSAEEMERYYTIPMEVGIYGTPYITAVNSTSFYGLSFLRVTFKYGVDFYFAQTQIEYSLQQNVSLPNNVQAQIQQSSLVGEVVRYAMVGPPHFGLANLRTVQDYIVLRRLSTVPGVVQVNSFGGPTKEFEVEADLQKLQTYGVTIPQVITALGNANVNVGGREINIGQQSVNIRGIGLFNDGGNDDLTKGYKVDDIENVAPYPIGRRAGPDQGRGPGVRRQRAPAEHGRQGSRRRCGGVHRGHGAHLPYPGHRSAHHRRNR